MINNRQLRQALEPKNGQTTIGTDTFDSPELRALLTSYNEGRALVIEQARLGVDDDRVLVNGRLSFLGVRAPVVATFRVDGKRLLAVFQLTLARSTPAWSFATSFGTLLQASLDFSVSPPVERSLLGSLSFQEPQLLLATGDYRVAELGVSVGFGLFFYGKLAPDAVGGLARALLGETALAVFGPIVLPNGARPDEPLAPGTLPAVGSRGKSAAALPGILLTARLDDSNLLGELSLENVSLSFYDPLDSDVAAIPGYGPMLFVQADASVSKRPVATLVAGFPQGSSVVTLSVLPEDFTIRRVLPLLGLEDSSRLASQLPSGLSKAAEALETLGLEDVSLAIQQQNDGFRVPMVSVRVGMERFELEPFPGFEVSQLATTFTLSEPFSSQPALTTMIQGELKIDGVPVVAMVSTPTPVALGLALGSQQSLKLSNVIGKYGPADVDFQDLVVDDLVFSMTTAGSFWLNVMLAQQPRPWRILAGVLELDLSNLQLFIQRDASGTTGTFSGTIDFGKDDSSNPIELSFSYSIPGSFSIQGVFPGLDLAWLVKKLTGLSVPSAFDVRLEQSIVLIERSASDYDFRLATTVDGLGSLIFEMVRPAGGRIGFVVGAQLAGDWKPSRLSPALAPLDVFRFQGNIALVASSAQLSGSASSTGGGQAGGFGFSSFAGFNNSPIDIPSVALPGGLSSIAAGLSVYAELDLGRKVRGSGALLRWLTALLGIEQASLVVQLQVGENPVNSMLSLQFESQFKKQIQMSGALQVRMAEEELEFGALVAVNATVHEKPLSFNGQAFVTENGAFLAASMQGSWSRAFGIRALTLSDLAFLIGVDDELVPSFGISGTLDAGKFQGALAIFFDSINPANSLLSGSISDVTLADVVSLLAQSQVPDALGTILSRVAIRGVPLFTAAKGATAAIVDALDNGRVSPELVALFKAQANVAIPSEPADVLVDVAKKGRQWFVTDKLTLTHWTLKKRGASLQVELQAQLFIALDGNVTLGNPALGQTQQAVFNPGFHVSGELDLLFAKESLQVEVALNKGISVQTTISKISLFGGLLRLTAENDPSQGPTLSLSTYDQPELEKPFDKPHFFVSGAFELLGLGKGGMSAEISDQGVAFEIEKTIDAVSYDVSFILKARRRFAGGGEVRMAIDADIPLGPLGTLHLADFELSLALLVFSPKGRKDLTDDQQQLLEAAKIKPASRDEDLTALVSGSFDLQALDLDLGPYTVNLALEVGKRPLKRLPALVEKQVVALASQFEQSFLSDGAKWLKAIRKGAVQGFDSFKDALVQVSKTFEQGAEVAVEWAKKAGYELEDIAKDVKDEFDIGSHDVAKYARKAGYSTEKIVKTMKDALGKSAKAALKDLQQAGFELKHIADDIKDRFDVGAKDFSKFAKSAGYSVKEIGNALKDVFHFSEDKLKDLFHEIGGLF